MTKILSCPTRIFKKHKTTNKILKTVSLIQSSFAPSLMTLVFSQVFQKALEIRDPYSSSNSNSNDRVTKSEVVDSPVQSSSICPLQAVKTDVSVIVDKETELLTGLEVLDSVNEIYVKKEPSGQRYHIFNEKGELLFVALIFHQDECLGQFRSFVITFAKVDAGTGEYIELFDVTRKRSCESVALRCVSDTMMGNNVTVSWSDGRVLGQVSQLRHCLRPTFQAEDNYGKHIFKVMGKCGGAMCNPLWACKVSKFQLIDPFESKEKDTIGIFAKKLIPTHFEMNDKLFGAKFPIEFNTLAKALVIAALFQLNVTYFDRRFSGIDMCVLVRYFILIGFIVAVVVAVEMGIFSRIFNNSPD